MTEHDYVMLALYLRGLGMGILFGPLTALGLQNIPRSQMAQASGLNNVIRQVGGGFCGHPINRPHFTGNIPLPNIWGIVAIEFPDISVDTARHWRLGGFGHRCNRFCSRFAKSIYTNVAYIKTSLYRRD